jgi:chromosome segregation ATPase
MSDHTAESCLERARTIITLRAQLAERDAEVERLTALNVQLALTDRCLGCEDLTRERDEADKKIEVLKNYEKLQAERMRKARAEVVMLEASVNDLANKVQELEAENATLRAALEESMRVLQVAAERAIDMGNAVVALGGADINRGQFLSLVEETWRTQRAALTAKEGKS